MINEHNAREYDALAENLRIIGSNVEAGGVLDPSYIRVVKTEAGDVLKTNSIIRRVLFYPYYHSTEHVEKVQSVVANITTKITKLERQVFAKLPNLSAVTQRYDQSVETANNQPPKTSYKKKVILTRLNLENVPELMGITPEKSEFLERPQKQRDDKPVKVKGRHFTHAHSVKHYPTDVGRDHYKDATVLFSATQIERFFNLVGRVLRMVGVDAKSFEKFRYSSGVDKSTIYSKDAPLNVSEMPQTVGKDEKIPEPTSYWLGHASCLLGIPLRSETGNKVVTLRVITDPVEGDLNPLLYPRMTKFAKPMDEIPTPQVYLLSHNHLDHYSKSTIKKLISQQPIMVVPRGDGYRYTEMGFQNVQELDWWQGTKLNFSQNNEKYSMTIRAVPARHWAGQGPCGGHGSTFLGYVLEGHEDGAIYFAGDTAPLDYKRQSDGYSHIQALRDFKPTYYFAPGGPDDVRGKSSHQCSAYGLQAHVEILLLSMNPEAMTKDTFLRQAQLKKTVYMHTMTFKLGNIKMLDTSDSLERVIIALKEWDSDQMREVRSKLAGQKENRDTILSQETKWIKPKNATDTQSWRLGLRDYEWEVLEELIKLSQSIKFTDNQQLTHQELAKLLEETVVVPKIGSNIGLRQAKGTLKNSTVF